MAGIKTLIKRIRKFNKDRDWGQFHTFKDLSLSLVLEAAEVLEHFQWKTDKEADRHVKKNKEKLADELADVGIYLLQLADKSGVDITKAIESKMTKNAEKYPIEKSKGSAKKYTEL